jgi:hypothetical protein
MYRRHSNNASPSASGRKRALSVVLVERIRIARALLARRATAKINGLRRR